MITLTFTLREIEALYTAHHALQLDITFNSHYKLLNEHRIEFVSIFYTRYTRIKEKNRITLTSLQALAFTQIWLGRPLAGSPYTITLINRIIGDIDKKSKQPEKLIYADH